MKIFEYIGYYDLILILSSLIASLVLLKIIIFNGNKKDLEVGMCKTIGERELQNDSFEVIENQCGLLGILCDGMGSGNTGKICNDIVIKVFTELFTKNISSNIKYFFQRAFNISNKEVLKVLNDRRGGSSTASVIIRKDKLYYGSVGNCRIFVYRNNELIPIIEGQTLGTSAEKFYRNGKLTKEEAESLMNEKMIINYIGNEHFREIDMYDVPIQLKKRDIIILLSDGVYNTVSCNSIEMALSRNISAQEAAFSIIERINRKKEGYKDNGSAVVIKYKCN